MLGRYNIWYEENKDRYSHFGHFVCSFNIDNDCWLMDSIPDFRVVSLVRALGAVFKAIFFRCTRGMEF
jgi:hypothetical protein